MQIWNESVCHPYRQICLLLYAHEESEINSDAFYVSMAYATFTNIQCFQKQNNRLTSDYFLADLITLCIYPHTQISCFLVLHSGWSSWKYSLVQLKMKTRKACLSFLFLFSRIGSANWTANESDISHLWVHHVTNKSQTEVYHKQPDTGQRLTVVHFSLPFLKPNSATAPSFPCCFWGKQ